MLNAKIGDSRAGEVHTVKMMGYAYLVLLVVQNTSKTLIMRYAVHGKPDFLYSAAVVATEGLKAGLSILWVLSTGGSPASIVQHLRSEWRTFVRVLIPAGVYNCQQMLEFVALSRLEARCPRAPAQRPSSPAPIAPLPRSARCLRTAHAKRSLPLGPPGMAFFWLGFL